VTDLGRSDKSVLVTGTSRGIGAAAAHRSAADATGQIIEVNGGKLMP
jgi:NAD(P)-dependent dehydrogenase (short-subunit alcohol dehydrogenase family)